MSALGGVGVTVARAVSLYKNMNEEAKEASAIPLITTSGIRELETELRQWPGMLH